MPKTKRPGQTAITSASLSKEFQDLMQRYNISPTEAMRRGVAVILCDMKVNPFNSELNTQRSEKSAQILNEVDRWHRNQFIVQLHEEITKLKDMFKELEKIK